jgi:hypothetical protein
MGFTKLCGLFKNDSPKGQYLSGKMRDDVTLPAGSKFFLFRNDEKKSPNSPDYNLCVKKED